MIEGDVNTTELKTEENEPNEILPFALTAEDDGLASTTQTLFGFGMNLFTSPVKFNTSQRREAFDSSSMSAASVPPALVSSVVSYPTDSESQMSGCASGMNLQPFGYSDNCTTSSGLRTPSAGDSSHLPHSREWDKQEISDGCSPSLSTKIFPKATGGSALVSSTPAASNATSSMHSAVSASGSIGFSQLMQVADNANDVVLNQTSILPALQEEPVGDSELTLGTKQVEGDSSTAIWSETCNCMGDRADWPKNEILDWLPICSPSLTHISRGSMDHHHCQQEEQQHLSSSLRDIRPNTNMTAVQVTQFDHNLFEVAVDIDPPCSVRDVMDIVGNPDLLGLWCDPIRSLIVIKSSEGARDAANRRGDRQAGSEPDREYEGEWIEATTMDLVSPYANAGSCLYSTSRALWSCVGFPSYGNVTMFVERPRARVGLTIGPFAGQVTASHTITVHDINGKIRIVDKVQLTQEVESNVFGLLCGATACVEKCFLPTIDGYMSQMSSSMNRLRLLVENQGLTCCTGRDEIISVHNNEIVSSNNRTPLLS